MSKLELKIPPVVVWIATGLLMWVGARLANNLGISWPHRQGIALGLICVATVIAALGGIAFRRAGTTVNPLHPENASDLVVGGIYRLTRNPMYLGMLLMLVGWAIWLGNVVPWLLLPGFVAYMNRFQIIPEERALTSMFGKEFALYRARVRRWL